MLITSAFGMRLSKSKGHPQTINSHFMRMHPI